MQQLHKLTDRVWYLDCLPETDRPNLGYVLGERLSVMVDSGNCPAHTSEYMSALDISGLPMPSVVFLTHHHWDHTFGLSSLKGLLSIAGEGTDSILREMENYTWDDCHLKTYVTGGAIPLFCEPHIRIEYPALSDICVKHADITFSDSCTLDIGGETIIMKHITSGHTDECYYLLCQSSGVLFLGDGDSEEVVGTDWIDHKDKLEQEIRELEAIDFKLCVTGHCEPRTKESLLNDLNTRLSAL